MNKKQNKQSDKKDELHAEGADAVLTEAGMSRMADSEDKLDADSGMPGKAVGKLAAAASDLTRAEDAFEVAQRVADLSDIAAAGGIADVAEGTDLLSASEDVTAFSNLLDLMGEDDLARGLDLANLAGELQAAGKVAGQMSMPVLKAFLDDRSTQLQEIAVDTLLQSEGKRFLSQVLAAKGVEVEQLGIEEVAEGLTRLAASQAMKERSQDLTAAGVLLALQGVQEVEAAAGEAGFEGKSD